MTKFKWTWSMCQNRDDEIKFIFTNIYQMQNSNSLILMRNVNKTPFIMWYARVSGARMMKCYIDFPWHFHINISNNKIVQPVYHDSSDNRSSWPMTNSIEWNCVESVRRWIRFNYIYIVRSRSFIMSIKIR